MRRKRRLLGDEIGETRDGLTNLGYRGNVPVNSGLCLIQWETEGPARLLVPLRRPVILHVCGKGLGHDSEHECSLCEATRPSA